MSRHYTAKCWLGSNSGYVDIEVNASSINGAREQLKNIYGAQQIINLREVRKGSGGTSSFSTPGTMWLVGIFAAGTAFLYFTPWVLMILYGAGGTWAAQKITGQTMQEYTEIDDESTTPEQHKKAAIALGSALLFGMAGFIHGTVWNKDLNKEYNLDGKQPTVEEVRQK